jgi:CheY-like chemotaxis protein
MHVLFYSGDFDNWYQHNSSFMKGKLANNFNDDIDQRINTYLYGNDNEKIDSFILPISLEENFYDFSGLIFAHHIRLTRNLKCCDIIIAFYGTLELIELLRITPLARLLLTDNVYYFNIAKYSFEEIRESIERTPHKFDLKQFIKQIQIEPPSNYEGNHHSADNEFALIQWSKYIGSYNILPFDFRKEFDSLLYFKYLKLKNDFPEIVKKDQIHIDTGAPVNILLIDDEAVKGWKDFYSSFFRPSSKYFNFEDSGIDFKDPSIRDVIISKVESKVLKFEADVVLLDLRLVDSDFNKETPTDKLTGLEILDKIKEINRGIQVIITTASNKALSFNLARQKGAYDFIIKDGLEDPEKAISKLNTAIQISAKRAKFLKEIGKRIDEIKNVISGNKYFNSTDDNIRNKLFSNLNLSFELLDLSSEIPEKQKYFAYSYLQLFICIEEFLKIKEVFEFGDKCYVNNSILVARKGLNNEPWSASIKFIDNNPSHYIFCIDENNLRLNPQQSDFKMSAVLIYLFNQPTSNSKNWPIIRDIRNKKAAHPEKGNITQGNIIHLLDFLLFIFDVRNISLENFKDGLTDEIKVEDIEKLKDLFNR